MHFPPIRQMQQAPYSLPRMAMDMWMVVSVLASRRLRAEQRLWSFRHICD